MSAFLDSNIVLYALGDEDPKKTRGLALLAAEPTISTQVINGCTTLYTEDLQHGQVIEGRLTLINPFLGLGAP